MKFSAAKRKKANALLKKHNIFWRFSETTSSKKQRTRSVQGNDARAFHCEPEVLVGLFDIFYGEQPAQQLDPLFQAAAEAADTRQTAAERQATTGRGRKRKEGPQPVGLGGRTSQTADVAAYREQRQQEEREAAAAGTGSSPVEPEEEQEEESDEEDDEEEDGAYVPDLLPAAGREDEEVGGVATAIDVWLTSIEYQEAAHARIIATDAQGRRIDDFDLAQRRAYAKRGAEKGRAWAEAVQRHSKQRAPWQYVHRAYAHFEEDALENGQRDTVNDEIIELGHRTSKKFRFNVFQGGTNECVTVRQTINKHTAEGTWESSKSKPRSLPKAVATQTHVKRHAMEVFDSNKPRKKRKKEGQQKRTRAREVGAEKREGKRACTKKAIEDYKQARCE